MRYGVLLLLVFVVFLPSLFNGFTSWDDNLIVLANPQVTNWSWQNTLNLFSSFHYGLYHPLVILSFAAEHYFFGFNPIVYHLTNLSLHVINCALVFIFVLLMTENATAALITALLFGIHPTRVESVAWVMERKDMLSSMFFLGALIFYVKRAGNSRINLAVPFFFFILALFSKSMAISLPFVLLLVDHFRGEKIDKENLKSKIPYFLLSVLFGAIAVLARIFSGELTRDPSFGINNIFIGSYRLIFYYLFRIIYPFRDAALYPGNSFADKSFSQLPLIYVLSPLLVAALLILFIYLFQRRQKIIFGGTFFIITILPALFMISIGPFADRFTYLPSIGIFLLAGVAGSYFFTKNRILTFATITALFLVLSFCTRQRCYMWKDSLNLWDAACKKYPLLRSLQFPGDRVRGKRAVRRGDR